MSLKTVEINSVTIEFDKEKTREYRTVYNEPCDCQDCRNYYKNVSDNSELVEFLSGFGVDFHYAEEIFSWDSENGNGSFIHYEGYYGVFGKIEGKDFSFENFGVKITFQKSSFVNSDKTGEYFWICVEGEFPYVLLNEKKRSRRYVWAKS